MAKNGPIILVEDDEDDIELMNEVLQNYEIKNKLVVFPNGPKALEYLRTTSDMPFVIICDVNLPMQTGIEFKAAIDGDEFLRKKSIPFVFYSTYVSQEAVNEAFQNLSVQGFFQKNDSYTEFRNIVKIIMEYWTLCRHPNSES